MHVKIHTGAVPDGTTPITYTAAKTVRMGFNPSKVERVDRMKALAAALVSECEAIRDEKGAGAREAAVAITQIQGASMFAVFGRFRQVLQRWLWIALRLPRQGRRRSRSCRGIWSAHG